MPYLPGSIRPLALACVAGFMTDAALAQRAALVQDMDNATRAAVSQASTSAAICTIAHDCYAFFGAVPAGRRRVVDSVSCIFNAQNLAIGVVELGGNSAASNAFIPAVAYPGNPGTFTMNLAGIEMPFEAGNIPYVRLFPVGGTVLGFLTCNVHGHDVAI